MRRTARRRKRRCRTSRQPVAEAERQRVRARADRDRRSAGEEPPGNERLSSGQLPAIGRHARTRTNPKSSAVVLPAISASGGY